MNYIVLFGIIAIIVFGCKSDSDKIKPEDRILTIQNSTSIGCKSVSIDDEAGEYIELQADEGNYLRISHINALFNCTPAIVLHAEVLEGRIIYSEGDTLAGSNCVCLFDLTCTIGPLEYDQYTFELNRAGDKIAEFDFNYTNSTLEFFNIE
jgi:hypothetical protein